MPKVAEQQKTGFQNNLMRRPFLWHHRIHGTIKFKKFPESSDAHACEEEDAAFQAAGARRRGPLREPLMSL